MEPLNRAKAENLEDDNTQLRDLLGAWKTPAASPALEHRVMRARQPWWTVLWTGYIRVPVPVACCAAVLLVVGTWQFIEVSRTTAPCQSPSVATTPHACRSNQPC